MCSNNDRRGSSAVPSSRSGARAWREPSTAAMRAGAVPSATELTGFRCAATPCSAHNLFHIQSRGRLRWTGPQDFLGCRLWNLGTRNPSKNPIPPIWAPHSVWMRACVLWQQPPRPRRFRVRLEWRRNPGSGDSYAAPASDGPKARLQTDAYFGSTTLSMKWITPLSATMSVATTLALSTVTLPVVPIVSSEPWTVLTLPAFTSLANTLPGTTW